MSMEVLLSCLKDEEETKRLELFEVIKKGKLTPFVEDFKLKCAYECCACNPKDNSGCSCNSQCSCTSFPSTSLSLNTMLQLINIPNSEHAKLKNILSKEFGLK